MGVERAVAARCSARTPSSRRSSPATAATTTWIPSIPRRSPTTPTPTSTSGGGGGLVLRGPQPEPGAGVVDEVRGRVRQARVQVRRRDRAQPRAQPVPAVRAGRASTSTPTAACRTTGVSYGYDVQGDNRRTSAVRAGSVEAGTADAQHRAAPGSHPRLQPGAERDVYTPKNAWGPRVGASRTTSPARARRALRAFWGRYFEGTASAFYTPGDARHPGLHRTRRSTRTAASARPRCHSRHRLRHQRRTSSTRAPTSSTSSFETQLTRTLRFTATGIWRRDGRLHQQRDRRTRVGRRSRSPTR